MASNVVRRPLPALIALVALLLLTAIVWWRVLNRGDDHSSAAACPTPTSTASTPAQLHRLPPPGQVDVQVLNATSRSGLAGKTRTKLKKAGFRSSQQPANDLTKRKDTVTGVAQIRYGASGHSGAQLLHYYLPGAQLVSTGAKDSVVTLSLGPRYRKLATPQAVRQAMSADHTTISRTAATHHRHTSSCTG